VLQGRVEIASLLLQLLPPETAGSFFRPFSFSLPMAKEKLQQAWKGHPTRKRLPAGFLR
jgi:hypothetical protein